MNRSHAWCSADISTAKESSVAVVRYSPLGHGFFTGQIQSRDDLSREVDTFISIVSLKRSGTAF